MMLIAAVVLASASLAVALILLLHRATGGPGLPVTVEWIETLSVDRYRPMLRLLDQRDLEFLKSQPGFRPAMAGRLRRQRCEIFQGYLRNLCSDFQRTCAALKIIMVRAEKDRPDLASHLMKAQATFAFALFRVQCRLALYRMGLSSVDVMPLVALFDTLQLELRSFVPVAG